MSRNRILTLLKEINQHSEQIHQISEQQAKNLNAYLQAAAEILTPDSSAAEGGMYEIWSDGACSGNPGPGGWGTIIHHNGNYREISGFCQNTTNNIMEMTGALEGIRNTPAGSRLQLTSDSQYLIKGMTEWIGGWKRRNWKKADGQPVLNKEIWIELDREASLRQVEWKWIRGHTGHTRNEQCDRLAKLAIENRGVNPSEA